MIKFNGQNNRMFNIALIAATLIISLFAVFLGSNMDVGDDIKLGEISPKRYTAPRSTENTVATERLRHEAYNSVSEIFRRDKSVDEKMVTQMDNFFKQIDEDREEYRQKKENVNSAPVSSPPASSNTAISSEDIITSAEDIINAENTITNAQEIVSNEVIKETENPESSAKPQVTPELPTLPIYLIDKEIEMLMNFKEEEYQFFKTSMTEVLSLAVERRIDEGSRDIYDFIKSETEKYYFEPELRTLSYDVVSKFVEPNFILDQEATRQAREAAMEEVEPIYYLKGQIIVDSNTKINEEAYSALENLGYTQKDWKEFIGFPIGCIIIVSILVFIGVYYIYRSKSIPKAEQKDRFLLFTIYNLCIITIWALRWASPFLVPIFIFTMISSILINVNFAITINSLFSVMAYLIMDLDYEYFIYFLVAGTVLAMISNNVNERSRIIKIGAISSIFNAVTLFGVLIIIHRSYSTEILNNSILALFSGVFSVIIAIGTLPFWEAVFGVLTPTKLLDLTNPNNPLLRRLTIEAPGTYHHSLIVANLAEAAAIDIGANPTIARVGGYYHDVGKLKYPIYFSENQVGENPHDEMDPYDSANVIKSHVSYGLTLAEEYKLPQMIKDMISTHHGTSMIKYFYYKAKKAEPEKEISESDFRYEYFTPKSKECAVVMLADTVEAAVRSMIPTGKTAEELEQTIRKLIMDKLDDRQLQDSQLTINDLETVVSTFFRVLKGMYHERISDPSEALNQKNKEAVESGDV